MRKELKSKIRKCAFCNKTELHRVFSYVCINRLGEKSRAYEYKHIGCEFLK